MPEAKRPLKVFLCHAHADRERVHALYTRLTNDGVDAWLDKEKLLPGQDWELEIRKAVREADVVVVCLSKQFNQAGFRQKEVRLALDTAMEKLEGEIFIIPARLENLDDTEIPESIKKWHWVDLFEDNGYPMLMRALQARANKIRVVLQTKRGRLPIISTLYTQRHKSIDGNDVEKDNESKTQKNSPLPGHNLPRPKNESHHSEATSITELTQQDKIKSFVKKQRFFWMVAAGFIILVFATRLSSALTPINKATQHPTSSATFVPSKTSMPSMTPSIVPSLTPTPTPHPITGDTIGKIALLAKVAHLENESFTCAAISPDGQILAVCSRDFRNQTSSVQLLKTEGPVFLKALNSQHLHIVRIVFSLDGSQIAAGSDDGTLIVWDVGSGKQIAFLKDTTESIIGIGFSSDGKRLVDATASRIEVWDIDSEMLLNADNIKSLADSYSYYYRECYPPNGSSGYYSLSPRLITSFAVGSNNYIAYTTMETYISSCTFEVDPTTGKPTKVLVPVLSTSCITNYGDFSDLQHMQQLSECIQVFDFSNNDEMLLGASQIINLTNNKITPLPIYGYIRQAVFSSDKNTVAITDCQGLSFIHVSVAEKEDIPIFSQNCIANIAFSKNGWILISSYSESVSILGIPRWNSTPTPTTAPPTAVR